MKKTQRHGFTLIELLVVVGILAVLIAILLPSLGRAKQTAKRSQCLASIKAWGQAVYTYATEFDGWFGAKRPGGGLGSQWDQNPKAYDVNATAVGIYSGQGGNSLATRLRFCPSADQQNTGEPSIPYYGNRVLPSYKFAVYMSDTGNTGTTFQKIQQFKNTAGTLLMCDSNAANNYGDCVSVIRKNGNEGVYVSLINTATLPNPRSYNGPGYDSEKEVKERHQGKGSALFLDGHAESLPWIEFQRNIPAGTNDTDLSKRWTRRPRPN